MGRARGAQRDRLLFALAALIFAGAGVGRGNPTGGQVVSGAATITTVPGTVTINQATTTASINWQDFSIATGELTRFQVPTSSSATLNRVTGGNISAIYGTLQSNGQLYLINPNGIIVGASGKIDTAGFMASTLNFSDAQFEKMGDLTLSGTSTAGIVNQGKIHASMGDVYLIAAHVDNSGKITAPKGTVGLAAGNSVLLQRSGDRHLFVQVVGATQPASATGVTNSGAIHAAAAELTAAGGNAYALAINNSGNIKATGIATINGQVYLTTDGADITNSGLISAKQANGNGGTIVVNAHPVKATTKGTVINSGRVAATGAKGGTVELLGDRVGVTDHGSVDVSGEAGGGTALIGGDEHGANAAVPDADQTYMGPDATIDADALTLGAGGKVIVWGNDTAQVYGAIRARGGATGGDGGFVETSAANLQVLTAPDVAAPMGTSGSWLLDPANVTISDTVTDSGFASSPAFTLANSGSFTPVTISQLTLLTALQNGNVTIDASTGSGGSGTITWNQSNGAMVINNAGGHTLTLDAPVSLTLSGVTVIATGTGGLNMVFNAALSGAGSVNLQDSTLDLNGGNFTANGNGYQSQFDQAGEANGVNLFGSSIDAEGGNINLAGNGGYANSGSGVSAGQGVGIFGDGSPQVALSTKGSGTITIAGTASPSVTSTTPLIGFYLDDGMGIQAEDGTIAITGVAGQFTSSTVSSIKLASGSSVESTTNTGNVSLTGSTEVDVLGTVSGNGVLIDSLAINLDGATVKAAAAAPIGGLAPLALVDDFGNRVGAFSITASRLTGSNIQIGYDLATAEASNFQDGLTQISIDGSFVTLGLGGNAPGTALSLQINGTSAVVGAPAVSITDATSITANDGGTIAITGMGEAEPGSNGTGVLISLSTITCGRSSGTSSGNLSITGASDQGFQLSGVVPSSTYSNNSYGVQVQGSSIDSFADGGLSLTGTAYAANNLASVGVDLSANTAVESVGSGSLQINGSVLPEQYSITGNGLPLAPSVQGGANLVAGVRTASTQITATGAMASVSIKTDTHLTTATDNGVTSVEVQNVGAFLQANTTVSASGSSTLLSTPIHIEGRSGPAMAVSGNTQLTDSFGLSIGGGTASGPVNVTNTGLGATVISGEGGATTGGGSSTFSVGVLIGGSSSTPASITAPDGGSIGITGVGGEIDPSGRTTGQAVGVWSLFSNITTTTGDIAIVAAAGSEAGTAVPSDVAGLDLGSSIIETNTGTAGANQIPDGGGAVPPLILIYATGSTMVENSQGQTQFQLGSPDSYAVREDTNSKLITGDLVMGNYDDLFSAYAPAGVMAPALSLSGPGVTLNPAGLVDLSSPLNQVSNLTAALDGSGGINFFDSTSLTVGTIGGSDNLNYGEIDEAGIGPVSITVAPNQSLTLTNISAFAGGASGLPVIATGAGSGITLTTSGTGIFTNVGGASALSAGSEYVVYVNDPSQAHLDGLAPATTLYSTLPGTVTSPGNDTLAYATGQPVGPNNGSGGLVPPSTNPQGSIGTSGLTDAVSDADNDDNSSSETTLNAVLYGEGDSLTSGAGIIAGGAGVSTDMDETTDDDQRHKHLKKHRSNDEELVEIQLQDARDGSTVNTGTTEPKLTANTGFSRMVHVSEYALLPSGSIQLRISDPAVARLFDEQATSSVHDEMSRAASGAKGGP